MLSVNPAISGSSASSANDNSSISAFVSQNSIGILAVVPSAPTSVVTVRGNAQLAVTWTVPASTGGSNITDYLVKYSSNNGSTWTNFVHPVSTATSLTVTGLANGTAYVIKVIAKNAVGISLASANSAPATRLRFLRSWADSFAVVRGGFARSGIRPLRVNKWTCPLFCSENKAFHAVEESKEETKNRGGEIRTPDLLVPNQARYQLRYAPFINQIPTFAFH